MGDFEEGTKKRGYTLDWVLLESGDNSVIKYLNKSFFFFKREKKGENERETSL